jgi:hypothetical protein
MDVMVDAYHLWSHGMKAGSMADHISPQYDEDIEGTDVIMLFDIYRKNSQILVMISEFTKYRNLCNNIYNVQE